MSMTCGLCKQPIRGDEHYVTDHYKCSAEVAQSLRSDAAKVDAETKALRNVEMMARREIARLLNDGVGLHRIAVERWQDVQRFCNEAGITSPGVLRDVTGSGEPAGDAAAAAGAESTAALTKRVTR